MRAGGETLSWRLAPTASGAAHDDQPAARCFLVDADNVAVEVIETGAGREAVAPRRDPRQALLLLGRVRGQEPRPAEAACRSARWSMRPPARTAPTSRWPSTPSSFASAKRPTVVVIVGSDSDFAPLVMHLRDRGCRVEGVGQEGKVGAECASGVRRLHLAAGRAGAGRRGRRPRRRRASAAREGRAGLRRRAAPRRRPRLRSCRRDVERWLDAVPGLASGERVRAQGRRRGAAARRSCSRGTRSSTTLFKKHPRLVRADAGPAAELGPLPPDFAKPQ